MTGSHVREAVLMMWRHAQRRFYSTPYKLDEGLYLQPAHGGHASLTLSTAL